MNDDIFGELQAFIQEGEDPPPDGDGELSNPDNSEFWRQVGEFTETNLNDNNDNSTREFVAYAMKENNNDSDIDDDLLDSITYDYEDEYNDSFNDFIYLAELPINPTKVPAQEVSLNLNNQSAESQDKETPQTELQQEKSSKPKKQSKEAVASMTTYDLAKLFMAKNEIKIIDGQFHVYDKTTNGTFVFKNTDAADLYIREKFIEELKYILSTSKSRELVQWFRAEISLNMNRDEIEKKAKRYIVFEDYTYDLYESQIIEHSPQQYALAYIHAKYPSPGQGCPLFYRIIAEMSQRNEKWIYRLQEIFGIILSNDRSLKQIMFFIGVPNSGKTLLLNILKLLIGEEFTSALSLKTIGARFGTSGLYRKRLNICGESSDIYASSIELLKSLSGGDLINIEFKGKDFFEFVNEAILLFAANKKINIIGGSADQAFLNRLLVLNFNYSIPEDKQDRRLLEKLKSELGAIAVWAIEGYKRLVANNYIFTEAEVDVNDYFEDENTHLREFTLNCLIEDTEAKTPTINILQAYSQYCRNNSIIPLSNDRVHDFLKNELKLKNDRFQIKGEQTRGYLGIRVRINF